MQNWLSSLNSVTIDFTTSQWYFPRIVMALLLVVGLIVVVSRFKLVVRNISQGKWTFFEPNTDFFRLVATLVLLPVYFFMMHFIGGLIPNMGMGFLLSSIPFMFLMSLIYCHTRDRRNLIIITLNAALTPLLVWFLLYNLFSVSLP